MTNDERKPLIELTAKAQRINTEVKGQPTELLMSDGKWYPLKAIVEMMKNKITVKALSLRVRDHGLDYELLFYPPAKRGHSLDGKKNGKFVRPPQSKRTIDEKGRKKLSDIPGPTVYERKYLGH